MVALEVAAINYDDAANGPGLRTVVFLQGCSHHPKCKHCQNPHTWALGTGTLMTANEVINKILEDPIAHAVTYSGGEPLDQWEQLIPVLEYFKKLGHDQLVYTGYTGEWLYIKLQQDERFRYFLSLIDTIITDPYLPEQRSLAIRFRGSRNQRVWKCEKGNLINISVEWDE